MEQLHRIKMARYYTLFNVSEVFSFRISDQRMFSHSVIKVAEVFFVRSNLAVATRITTNYSRADFLLKSGIYRSTFTNVRFWNKIEFLKALFHEKWSWFIAKCRWRAGDDVSSAAGWSLNPNEGSSVLNCVSYVPSCLTCLACSCALRALALACLACLTCLACPHALRALKFI